MSRLLMIDDDRSLCRSLQIQLKKHGHDLLLAHTGEEGLALADDASLDLILLDLGLPDGDGLEVLRSLMELEAHCLVAVVTGRSDMKSTVTAMRDGAFDYIRKPFELADIMLLLEKARRYQGLSGNHRREAEREGSGQREMVGSSPPMLAVMKQIGLLARSQVTVLITGESGTGKELAARALHDAGSEDRPFVAVNCSAVTPTLFESEIFGHEKGAFTGAERQHAGKLEQAADGTIFFDEIGDMPLGLQAKLLRALQEMSFVRVGGTSSVRLAARVVAATNQDLQAMVRAGDFREDLYFRLAVSPIHLPPLRERRDDIRAIAQHLLSRRARELHSKVTAVTDDAIGLLTSYDWPGNVRELENALTRAIALAHGDTLRAEDFGFLQTTHTGLDADSSGGGPVSLEEAEKRAIRAALCHTDGNITHAAKILGITRTTLRKKTRDYGIAESAE